MRTNRGSGTLLDATTAVPVLEDLAQLHEGVVLADPEGCILWVSDALEACLGGSGSSPTRRWEALFVDPARGAALWQALQTTDHLSNEQAELATPNGKPLRVALTAVRLASESETGAVVGLVRPRGESNRAGRELRRTLDHLAPVLECAPDAVIVADTSGFITYANPAIEHTLGYTPQEVLDEPIALYLHQRKDVDRIAAALRSVQHLQNHEIAVRRRDGSSTTVSVSARALRLRDGTQVGSVAFLRETSQVRDAEDTLRRKNAELEHTLRAVSHDLRSPLVALLGFSRLLREDFADRIGDKGRHFLHRIEQAGRTMESLTRDLLEVARIDDKQMSRSLVDPREVLLQLHAELKERLDSQGTQLQLPEDPPLLNCDRTRLYQVLSNLIGNALDHMGPTRNPCIVVEFTEAPEEHRITVRDNGRGIAPEKHDRIFELFHSASPRADGRRGTGVGLAIVKKIAETHGGRIWVESRPGEGASFHVTLPRSCRTAPLLRL
jgi:PAS domain S-box-containing protein